MYTSSTTLRQLVGMQLGLSSSGLGVWYRKCLRSLSDTRGPTNLDTHFAKFADKRHADAETNPLEPATQIVGLLRAPLNKHDSISTASYNNRCVLLTERHMVHFKVFNSCTRWPGKAIHTVYQNVQYLIRRKA